MSLLDRLRGQPGWRHEDPAVRASAVDDLEDDAQELFEAIASEDADPEVRLAALVRLSDPTAIGRIVRTDADPQVRDEATAMLRAAAVAASEPTAGEAALAGLSEARDVGEVARVARVESVSRSALARLDSQRAIGAVARRSAHRAVREAALAKLDDRDELAAVAVKTDHREVALAAFDRLAPLGAADRDLLQAIAVRARTKPVSRRAKSALAALDARPQPPTPEEVRARREEICERVEMLARVQRRDAVSAGLDQAERDWRALAAPSAVPPAADAPGAGEPVSGAALSAAAPPPANEVSPAAASRDGDAPPAVADDAPPAADAPGAGEPVSGTAPVSAAAPPAAESPPASEAPPADASPAADVPPAAAPISGDTPVSGDAPPAAAAPAAGDAPVAGTALGAADAPVSVRASISTVAAAPAAAPPADGQAVAPVDPALAERWRAAVAAALDHLAQLDKARGVADQRRQARRDALAARAALCDRLAALAADEARDADALAAEIDVVRAEWTALPEVPPGDDDAAADRGAGDAAADRVAGETAVGDRGAGNAAAGNRGAGDASAQVDRRFDELVAAAGRQVDRRRAAAARLPRLTALVEQLEALSASTDPEALTKGWKQPHREWTALAQESTAAELAGLAPRVEAAERKRSERLTAARETRRRREQANLARQQARCDDIERALADEQLELKDAERCLRLTRSLLGDPGRLPSRQDREALAKRLRAAQTALTGRVRELRGLAEWKQWANVGVQAALCQRLEALAEHGEDDAAFAREFREIMSEWRQASDVARDEGNDVWQRFKAAHDAVHPRFEAWQDAQAGVRRENLAKKVALCEEAERLSESTDWIKVAQRMTELQEQWKQVGSAARKDEREVWNRFRAASGHFFRRRRQDLAERKQVWAKNAQLKEELCGKAEALADESNLEAAKSAVRQLQAEWKTVGPVRRSRSEALWRRFRAACDDVHARAQAAIDAPYAELIQARAAVCDRLEALAPSPDAASGAADAPSPKAAGAADAPSPKAAAGAADAPSPDAASSPADALGPEAGGAAEAPAPDAADGAADTPAPDAAGGAADAPAPDAADSAAEAPAPDAAGAAGPPPDLAATVEAARREWRAMEPIPRPQERSLTARFDAAVNLLVDRFPGAFAGTDLDPVRHLPALERLCERVEAMIREDAGTPSAEARSPSEILAARLREALASNTMGAGADADAKRREDAETMGRLQAERRSLGVIPGEAGRQLSERFRAACDRFFKLNPTPPPAPSSGAGKPRRGGLSRAGGPSRRRRG